MRQNKPAIKLTELQREVLEELKLGGIILLDKEGTPWLGDKFVRASIEILTEKELIVRLDKSKPVKAKGNGYIISEKGLELLSNLPPRKKSKIIEETEVERREPTEKQLAYAKDIGINVPSDATLEEVSEMISMRVDDDKPSNEKHRSYAQLYKVNHTKYTGKKELFERIFRAVSRPTHELELLSWFTFRVYRNLVRGAENAPIQSPEHSVIKEIATELLNDDSVIQSVKRYSGKDLIFFGEWTSPSGWQHTGGSRHTVAFQRTSTLLRSKLGLPEEDSPQINRIYEKSVSSKNSAGCLSVILISGTVFISLLLILF